MAKRIFRFLGIGIFFFWGLELSAQEQPRYGGTLNVGIHSDLYGLNPFVRMRSIDLSVRSIVYEALVAIDAKSQVRPFLAESWKISPDGKEYTFNLRRGVKFHNGAEMTAEDIKWVAEYSVDPQHGATGKPYLEKVESVRVVDRYTVKFVLKQPAAAFLTSLGSLRTFFVLPKDSIPKGQTKVQTMPPGTGPFAFREWRAGSHAAFERFSDYWQKGLPYLDRVVFKPVIDTTARLAALRAGDLQLITRVPSAWVPKIRRGEAGETSLVPAKYAGFREIYLNVARPPFNNIKLRQAVLYAIDKEKILEGAFWGQGEVTEERFFKGSPWHFGFPDRKRDLAKAKALLKQAGYKGEKIVAISRQGQEEIPFSVAQLQEAGLNVVAETLEAGAYRARNRAGDYDISPGGGNNEPDPDQVSVEFTCDEDAVKRRARDNNRTGYCNKELDALFNQASGTMDPKKRRELYRKAFRIIYEEVPEVFLAFEHRFLGIHPRVRDFISNNNEDLILFEGGLHKTWLSR